MPTDQEAVFRSGNSNDPRLGDLLGVASETSIATIKCAFLGVPQSIGIERNGGRPGAERAPLEIRRALSRMATSAIQTACETGRMSIVDVGDIDCSGSTLEQIHDAQSDAVGTLFDEGYIPIILGGGHDTAWPTIRAIQRRAKPFSVINIDAHADVRELKDDSTAHSGSPFRQLIEVENSHLVDGGFTEYGLQHYAVSADHLEYLRNSGCVVHMLDDIRSNGSQNVWNSVLQRSHGTDLYITLDTDGFASAFAPGVSAPSADGFSAAEIGPQIRAAARTSNCIAFDVVEVSPPFDIDGRTAKLAASMIMQFLAGLADKIE